MGKEIFIRKKSMKDYLVSLHEMTIKQAELLESLIREYDDSENGFKATGEGATAKTAEENMLETLAACDTTPVYVVPVAGSPIPKLTKTATAGTYAKVVKLYTIPNGGIGVKYQIVHL